MLVGQEIVMMSDEGVHGGVLYDVGSWQKRCATGCGGIVLIFWAGVELSAS
jgi:hypothetical protein